jgi:glycosyltransferase involved in cell wall biosynthesis
MNKLLFVLPDLEYNGAARQMLYLATGLPRDRFELRVCVLGQTGPWRADLVRAGIPVDALGWHRALDIKPLSALRGIIRSFRPDVIHVWRMPALRAVLLAGFGMPGRLIVSSAVSATTTHGIARRLVDRCLLRQADKIVAGGAHEWQVLQILGVDPGRIAQVAPAVAPAPPQESSSIRAALGLPLDVRLIACIGPLESEKGFRDAIWALDILRFVFDDIHLLFLGTGSGQDQLRHFARILTVLQFVHFLGPQENVRALLSQVDMVWVPSQRNTGVNAALEAMAAGRPLVATHVPILVELVPPEAGRTLIKPQDQGSLARQTRLLLDGADKRSPLIEAGRKHVAEYHSVQALVEQCAHLYEEITRC